MRYEATLLGFALLLAGCPSGQEVGALSAGGTEETGGGEDESGGEEGTTSGETTDGEGEDEGQPYLDVAPPPDEDPEGCEKVDFLFVIDNSISMADNQDNLIASFPGFIDAIQSTLNATDDYHIMVVDTDAETRCTPQACADDGDQWAQCLCPGPSNGNACSTEYDSCDLTLGAGVVNPRGSNASNVECALVDDARYITKDEPDLLEAFSCVAQVGEAGHQAERPMEAMVAALGDEINGPGGCNQDFLRDDAILVVVFISDDENHEDQGDAQSWRDAVVAAKGGNAASVVVLGLVPEFGECDAGGAMGCMIAGVPDPNPQMGQHWIEFVESFGQNGMWAHVCEPDYSPFFAEAVELVDQVCDAFEPQG